MLDRMHPAAAMRAPHEMRCDRNVLALVQCTCRKCRQEFIGWMMPDSHDDSPNTFRSRFIARRNRDFTVPNGIWRICAISPCAFSS